MKKKIILGVTALLMGTVLTPIPVQAATNAPIIIGNAENNCGIQWGVIIGGNNQSSLPDCNIQIPSLPGCDLSNLPEICFPGINFPNPCPDTGNPGTENPGTENPGTENPGTENPDTENPDTENPGTEIPGTENPGTEVPGTENPGTEEPDTENPGAENPGTEVPGTENPGTENPGTENPGTENPGTEEPGTEEPGTDETEEPVDENASYINQVLNLVNVERAKAGLSPLSLDAAINNAAMVRAEEIQSNFSHTRPNGSGFYTALREAGVIYRQSGENIAWGQQSPAQVVDAWMNSSGHRANIMSPDFTRIGVGYMENSVGTPYWVQLFAN